MQKLFSAQDLPEDLNLTLLYKYIYTYIFLEHKYNHIVLQLALFV